MDELPIKDNAENNARHRLIRTYQMRMKDSDSEHPIIITEILRRLSDVWRG